MIGFLGLGSNVGDPRAMLQGAVDGLLAQGIGVLASSSVYETDPVGLVLDQPPFLNAALQIETDLEPEALLAVTQGLEDAAQRDRTVERHGPRTLDVDLLLLGDRVVDTGALVLPHPGVLERRFVLVPLLELDFDLRTPAGASLAEALAVLPIVGDGVRRHGPPLRTVPGRR